MFHSLSVSLWTLSQASYWASPTHPPRVWKEQESPGKAHLFSQSWMPTSFCSGLWVDKASIKSTAFHSSWSLSLVWDPTISLLGFPACRWQILRLPMMQQAGLLLTSNLCALLTSPLWTKCVNCLWCTLLCQDPPHLASRGTWQPFIPSFPVMGIFMGSKA